MNSVQTLIMSYPSCISRHTQYNCAGCYFTWAQSFGQVNMLQLQPNSNELHVFTLEMVAASPQALTSELDGADLKYLTKTESEGSKHILNLAV